MQPDKMKKNYWSFTQYPLRLAWAITIQKPGLTFEKAVIDSGTGICPRQVYLHQYCLKQ